MNSQSPRKKFKASATLVVTFILGIGVGFSLCYAFFETLGTDFSGQNGTRSQDTAHLSDATTDMESKPDEVDSDLLAEPDWEPDSVACHLFIGITGNELDDVTRSLLGRYPVGGVVLREENIENDVQATSLIRSIHEASTGHSTPPYIAVIQDGGIRNPLLIDTPPSPAELGELNHVEATAESARITGIAAQRLGIDVVISPSLDYYLPGTSHPLLDLEEYTFGASPDFVAEMGIHYASVLLENGVLPVVKHYPGLGAAQLGEDGIWRIEETNIEQLALSFLPFARAADENIGAMLVAQVAVPGLDIDHADRPAALSPRLVTGILREQWQYKGVVLAEDISFLGANPMPRVLQALQAGCDAVLLLDVETEVVESVIEAIQQAVESETIQKADIQTAQSRLIAWRKQLPVKETPAETPVPQDESTAPDQLETEAVEPEAPEEMQETSLVEDDNQDVEEADLPYQEEPEPEETDTQETPELDYVPEQDTEASLDTDHAQQTVTHTITSGDTLYNIARRYGVTPEDIKRWNALDSDVVKEGYKLEIHLSEKDGAEPSEEVALEDTPEIAPESTPDMVEENDTTPVPDSEQEEEQAHTTDNDEFIRHTIQIGDSLQRIADRHGVPMTVLVELNDIRNPDIIALGSEILIPRTLAAEPIESTE